MSQPKNKKKSLENSQSVHLEETQHEDSSSAEANQHPLKGTILGNYKLIAKIGEGSSAVIYKAEHLQLGSHYAVKIMHPAILSRSGMRQRFVLEAKAASRLRHENIIYIADFAIDPAIGPYMVMEYLEGNTLHAVLNQESSLSIERILRISEQICSSLAFAHDAGVIHRDFKPENVFIIQRKSYNILKILDFGIAHLMQSNVSITGNGQLLGTPLYMSPEQCKGEKKFTNATDIYSFGVVLFQMLTGRTPFEGETAHQLILDHLMTPPPQLSPNFPLSLRNLLQSLLRKDPHDRPDSMDDIWVQLDFALKETLKSEVQTDEFVRVDRTTSSSHTSFIFQNKAKKHGNETVPITSPYGSKNNRHSNDQNTKKDNIRKDMDDPTRETSEFSEIPKPIVFKRSEPLKLSPETIDPLLSLGPLHSRQPDSQENKPKISSTKTASHLLSTTSYSSQHKRNPDFKSKTQPYSSTTVNEETKPSMLNQRNKENQCNVPKDYPISLSIDQNTPDIQNKLSPHTGEDPTCLENVIDFPDSKESFLSEMNGSSIVSSKETVYPSKKKTTMSIRKNPSTSEYWALVLFSLFASFSMLSLFLIFPESTNPSLQSTQQKTREWLIPPSPQHDASHLPSQHCMSITTTPRGFFVYSGGKKIGRTPFLLCGPLKQSKTYLFAKQKIKVLKDIHFSKDHLHLKLH